MYFDPNCLIQTPNACVCSCAQPHTPMLPGKKPPCCLHRHTHQHPDPGRRLCQPGPASPSARPGQPTPCCLQRGHQHPHRLLQRHRHQWTRGRGARAATAAAHSQHALCVLPAFLCMGCVSLCRPLHVRCLPLFSSFKFACTLPQMLTHATGGACQGKGARATGWSHGGLPGLARVLCQWRPGNRP